MASFKKFSVKNGNHVINGLWIGNDLSLLELLTLKSFVDHGHEFHLWVYDTLNCAVPKGVKLKDANRIIPESKVFRYKNSNQFGHGKGSVSGFSDIFRYKLLLDHGGWWVDMDVTCLRPFDFAEPYFFRSHHELSLVGNVIKCPKGSPLMLRCYEDAARQITEQNRDWHKPIQILNDHVLRLGLSKYVYSDYSISDQWHILRKYLYQSQAIIPSYYFIHWMNEEWRSKGLDKYDFMIKSLYGRLLVHHGLVSNEFSSFNLIKNTFRFKLKSILAHS